MSNSSQTTIKAEKIGETAAAWNLNCEGDVIWVPKSQVTFNEKEKTLTLPDWLYKEKFPNG